MNLKELSERIWEMVASGTARGEIVTVREVYGAISAEMILSATYNPERDVRVKFLREVLRVIREGKQFHEIDKEISFAAGYAMGLMGVTPEFWQDKEAVGA